MDVVTTSQAAPDKPTFMGAMPVVIKMVADKNSGRLLGVQAVGTGDVSKRVAQAAMALHGNMKVSALLNLDLPYASPFSPAIEIFITAVHFLENAMLGRMK